MKAQKSKIILALVLLSAASPIYAQATSSPNYLLWSLGGLAIIVLLTAIISIADNLLQLEAHKQGLNTKKNNYSLFPSIDEMFGGKNPEFTKKGTYHKLKKGYNLLLNGEATGYSEVPVSRFSLKPQNFVGMSPIPKVEVQVGDKIKAGEVVFYDKKRPEVKYVSPVSGEVVEVRRGAKRSITDIIITAEDDQESVSHSAPSLKEASREDIVSYMLATGGWTQINSRPYDMVPAKEETPDNIFISTFSSAPLAPCMCKALDGNEAAYAKGLEVLARLTEGKVYQGVDAHNRSVAEKFSAFTEAETHWFEGRHPYGNVGVQIHHIAPIGTKGSVWTLGVNEVITVGYLFLDGTYRANRVVAVTGAQVKNPTHVKTYQGASVGDLLKGNIAEGNQRVIGGDVYTGSLLTEEGFIDFRNDHITVIEEGDKHELFGWLLPVTARPSISRTFPSFMFPEHKFDGETNMHGEKRAFVMTGQYESVMPMDIYPQHLMKAILTNDYERMEGLGLRELSEEDVALCEFVCASKQPLQKILRDGLEMMRDQE